METPSVQGTPCPLCGEVTFAIDPPPTAPFEDIEYACLWDIDVRRLLHPRECTCCGNIQVLLTRC
jgi:hypothetical protein